MSWIFLKICVPYDNEDRTKPCSTSALISLGAEISPSTESINFLCERKALISLIGLAENYSLDSLFSKKARHVVSKAFSTSCDTATLVSLLLELSVAWLVIMAMLSHRNQTGRAVAQAVSRRLPTAASPVRAWVKSCGICSGQSGTGQVSSEYFGFLCHSFIPLTAPQPSPSVTQGWRNRPIKGNGISGLGCTPAPVRK
jgi:hypothetical protein